jgi:HSP20 family protein
MANLAARDPFFQELFDFRRDFDRVFNRFLSWPSGRHEDRSSLMSNLEPAVEAYLDRNKQQFLVNVSLAGIDPKDVNIQVHGKTLLISGERREQRESKESDYTMREIVYGSFERTLPLPEGVDPDKITAENRNGLLQITAPVSAAALPRRIEVKSTGQPMTKQAGAGGSR